MVGTIWQGWDTVWHTVVPLLISTSFLFFHQTNCNCISIACCLPFSLLDHRSHLIGAVHCNLHEAKYDDYVYGCTVKITFLFSLPLCLHWPICTFKWRLLSTLQPCLFLFLCPHFQCFDMINANWTRILCFRLLSIGLYERRQSKHWTPNSALTLARKKISWIEIGRRCVWLTKRSVTSIFF